MQVGLTGSIAVAGAGSIGCYVGGCLALAGKKVTLLARPRLAERVQDRGLMLTGFDGLRAHLPATGIAATADPAEALAQAALVLVTVKSRDTEAMARLIAVHAPPNATVVSLQNGVRNVETLRLGLPRHRVMAGMVPFNVVQSLDEGGTLRMHRATRGTILVAREPAGVAQALDVPHAPVVAHADMQAVQWGKLLLNLNNALNALSGLPLAEQLAMRPWRLLLAAQMQEALACLSAAKIAARGTEGVPLRLVPHILRLPNALFLVIARGMLAIDPSARSSMWEDLTRQRPTEIDVLQGEILNLAERHQIRMPVTRAIVTAVKQAEAAGAGSPGFAPEAIRSAVKAA
ncbi:MAG: 2-dehydropantoate 2-reductase [Hyphomicrobiales bacterium]|nr:MAG: 2-dehydropantoate 2-reductase [Hyphomicrobiales bacterium]